MLLNSTRDNSIPSNANGHATFAEPSGKRAAKAAPRPEPAAQSEHDEHRLVDDGWMNAEERHVLDQAIALVPVLREREQQCLAERSVPKETFEDFKRLGLTRIVQPRRWGGMQGSTVLLSRVVEELSLGCPSSAWVLGVYGEHSWVAASFGEQAQEDVWGEDTSAVVCTSLAPRATATAEAGGYRVTGTYPFASGCRHASWIIVAAFVQDGDARHVRYFLVPMPEVEILDDWQVLGLRGTGSNTIALHDVFIPEHRTVKESLLMTGDTPGSEVHPDYPLLRAPRIALAIFTQLPVTLGVARRVLHHTRVNMKGRVARATVNLSESQVVQMKIGEASADIESAIVIANQRHLDADRRVRAGETLSPGYVQACRRDSVWAGKLARRGVEKLVSVSSAEIVHDRNELQGWQRDILTTGSHFGANWETAMAPFGKMLVDTAS